MSYRKYKIQRLRSEYAEMMILEYGYDITYIDETVIKFYYNDKLVTFYPFKGWATGKSIQDGRGLNNLLKQLK